MVEIPQMNNLKSDSFERSGAPYQLLMIGTFIMSGMFQKHQESWFTYVEVAALTIFLYCYFVLYVKNSRSNKLITTFPFNCTRHPMYTAIFVMNLGYWYPTPPNQPIFFTVQVVFLFCLIVASYYQEKETLARFGKEAEEYYKRTPRLFFVYPLILLRKKLKQTTD